MEQKATRILELDVKDPLQPVYFEEAYDHYRILVRANKQPLGWIHFSKNKNGFVDVEQIQTLISTQVGALPQQSLFNQFDKIGNSQAAPEGISVIVCTRNRTAQLSACLLQLLSLKYEVFEIIVVDNAPANDDTKMLTAELPVRYVREERPGLDWARNRGIAEAKYDIVAFTDDDVRVDAYWLQAIGKIFTDKQVMGASGFVAPAELETPAQHLFESGYGGMGHGFHRRYFKKERLTPKQLLWASSFGIGANMAFRKKVFETIGGFDTALDVGTPSHGAGDVEMFHRLVAKGYLFVYEPSMLVWHYHRREINALKKQVYDNGRSFGCYLINCFRKKTVGPRTIVNFFLKEWLFKWILKNLFRRRHIIPATYTLKEISGMLSSPTAYRQTKNNDHKIRRTPNP